MDQIPYPQRNNQSRQLRNPNQYQQNPYYPQGNNQSRPSNNQDPYQRNPYGNNQSRQPYYQDQYQHKQYSNQSGRSYGQGSGYTYGSYQQSYSRGSDIDQEDQQMLSRQLSSILRHRALSMKLKIDSGGFVLVDEILRLPNFQNADLKVIQKIVEKDTKQRFYLKTEGNRVFIRANQGHSFELPKLDLKEILDASEYPTVLHGTYYENWKKIRTQGLKTMQRNHIHFAADMPGSSGVISGMRQSCEIIVYLNLEKALQDGLKFYLSSNNVILSSGNQDYVIGPQYFEKVVDYMTGRHLSLTEPVETSPSKSSNISDRVAAREAHTKPNGKSSQFPLGYNPIDDTSSEKANRKNKDKKKGSKNNNTKEKVQDVMAKQERGNTKASEKRTSDVIEPKQEAKTQKLKRDYEITLAVNLDKKDRDEEEEAMKKSKRKNKNSKQKFSDSKDEEPVTEELETLKSENDAVIVQQFDSTLEQELLEMDKIAVLAQSKILAAGNLDNLIIFDKGNQEDIAFFQKLMNSQKNIKLITQTTSCSMKLMDIKQFQNVLDLSILYNEMNTKSVNGDVKALYEKATDRNSKLPENMELQPKNVKLHSNHKKAALSMWHALELYKYYEKRLNQKTQKKIFKSSLEELVKENS